ncbi:MAG: hypothetical protein HWN65_20240 [Candidatus Helarchaeota archaeon]|nr:hypothetical protein [Candidatus Helarchaeota archaeon]
MPKGKSKDKVQAGQDSGAQNIPEEVLRQLPPEVKAQLGIVEAQKPIFKPPSGADAGLSDSIDRLREGFEKIGLTLIGRMGEFASTLERVVMTVSRIEKVENLAAETTYFLKNLQKTLEGFKRDFSRMTDSIDNMEIEMSELKQRVAGMPAAPIQPSPEAARAQPAVTQTPSASVMNAAKSPVKKPITAPIAAPTTTPPSLSAPAPAPTRTPDPVQPPAPTPAPEPTPTGSPVDILFRELYAQIKVELNPKMLADLLDRARERITQTCKWTPAIYEIGKLARKIRRSKKVLSHKDISDVNETLDQLKKQMVSK